MSNDMFQHGYVSAAADLTRALEEAINSATLPLTREQIYARFNPTLISLIKANAGYGNVPYFVDEVTESVKCAMCDKKK